MNGAWACFRNYRAHADEIGGEVTENPLFFLKPHGAIVSAAADGSVPIALGDSTDLIHHEVEWVIRLGDDLRPADMCIGIDTTNRTRQTEAKVNGWPWLEGKGFRGSAVCGTWVPYQPGPFEISLDVNGEIRQSGSTSAMVHDIESLLSALGRWYGLFPGDLLFTGTPEGVGQLEPGDFVQARLGPLASPISILSGTCT